MLQKMPTDADNRVKLYKTHKQATCAAATNKRNGANYAVRNEEHTLPQADMNPRLSTGE